MKYLLTTVAVIALLATSVKADVIFDPVTGTGEVGRGDIQSRFGDASVTPEGAELVTFTLIHIERYLTSCKEKANPSNVQDFSRRKVTFTDINSEVKLSPQGNVTGWDLTGLGSSLVKGRFCPPGWRVNGDPQFVKRQRDKLRAGFEDQQAYIWIEDDI